MSTNPPDDNATETVKKALKEIVAITIGDDKAQETCKALAVGADRGIHVKSDI